MNELIEDSIQMNENTEMKLYFRPKSPMGEALFYSKINDGKIIHGFALNEEQTQKLKNFLFTVLRTSF